MIKYYLYWHYQTAWRSLLSVWDNFLQASLHLFAVSLHLRYFFSPWHRIYLEPEKSGFSLQKIFFKFTYNLISRIIAVMARTVLLLCGFTAYFIVLVSGMFVLLVWPFFMPFSVVLFLLLNPKAKSRQALVNGEAKQFIKNRLGINEDKDLAKAESRDIDEVLKWYLNQKKQINENAKFWKLQNLYKLPSIGSSLVYGYTNLLDKFALDYMLSPPMSAKLVGRDKEIRLLETALCRSSQSNAIIIGKPGIGKQAILTGFANKIKTKNITRELYYFRVVELLMTRIAGASDSALKLEKILKSAESAGNIILIVRHFADYVSDKKNNNLADVFSKFADSSKLKIIAVTTPDDWEKFIYPNELITKSFEPIRVQEIKKEQAMEIIQSLTPEFEKNKNVITTYPALSEIILQSEKLITDIPFPEKAVDLLEQAIISAGAERKKIISKEDVRKLVSEKLRIPVGIISLTHKQKLLRLEQLLAGKIVGQKPALTAITSALQRSALNLGDAQKPIGSFLFLGPTGVGKTETAKVLAESFFGDSKHMIRVDMAEFQSDNSIQALIGSENSAGLLTQAVRERPYTVLLLDEFEKASISVKNLFLTIFDEGYFNDSKGKQVLCRNLVIICTSNAGSEIIRETLKQNPVINRNKFKDTILEHVLAFGHFSPELVNRFDAVVIFHPLSKLQIKSIIIRLLNELQKQIKDKQIALQFDIRLVDLILKKAYDLHFGARPIKRYIADHIETIFAKSLLAEKLKKGHTVILSADDSKIIYKIKEQ